MSGLNRMNWWEAEIDLAHLARIHNVTVSDLLSGKRNRELVDARTSIAKELLRAGFNESQIGELLNRDRTSIYHYYAKDNPNT